MTEPAPLTTFAPQIQDAPDLLVTGNLVVSLPEIDRRTGAVHSLGVLLHRPPGLLQAHGDPTGTALVEPFLRVDGVEVPLGDLQWTIEGDWLPTFTAHTAHGVVEGSYCAPVGERGIVPVLRFVARGPRSPEVVVGWRGEWAGTSLTQLRPEPVDGVRRGRLDPWTGSRVVCLSVGVPMLAIAWQGGEGVRLADDGDTAGWTATVVGTAVAGEVLTAELYLSVAPEPDGAATGALHLRRRGATDLRATTVRWLARHSLDLPDQPAGLRARTHGHLWFNYFFAQGDCLDTGTPVLLTSRSPHYYVSGAFWSRDAYCWTFPALLLCDGARARAVLVASLAAAGPRVADHALYLNGTSLYPGFELDQAAAPVLAVWRYVRATADLSVLSEPPVRAGLEQLIPLVDPWRHPTLDLYGTFLLPTDDPTRYPYVTTANALLAAAFAALADLVEGSDGRLAGEPADLRGRADAVRSALVEHLIVAGPHGRMWAWACDEAGRPEIRDEAPLGLRTLPFWGVGTNDDNVQRATVAWLRENYAHSYVGRYPGAGAPHFPFPSGFDLANRLLDRDEAGGDALRQLVETPMDHGLACESWDAETGVVRTGAAMASMAGLLAWTTYARVLGLTRWDQTASQNGAAS